MMTASGVVDVHKEEGVWLMWTHVDRGRGPKTGLISAKCQAPALIYKDDLVADELVSELSKFRHYCRSHGIISL